MAVLALQSLLGAVLVLTCTSPASGFDIEDLQSLVDSRELGTVEAVVAALPEEFLRNYTLARRSRSLQQSSDRYPRVIMFGADAGLVLAFNGHPDHAEHEAIEAMQFKEDPARYHFYRIGFDASGAVFSQANPAVCGSCHGEPGQPVWSSYEYEAGRVVHWPGFYGAVHDAPALHPEGAAAFRAFRDAAGSHPRYRHLVRAHPDSEWYPYGYGPRQHYLRPNNRLGNLLARRHARYLAARIAGGEFYRRRPVMAAAWLLGCPQSETAVFRRRVSDLFAAYRAARRPATWLSIEHGPRQTDLKMQAMLTDADPRHWNMDLPGVKSPQFYSTGIVSITGLVAAQWLAALPRGDALRGFYRRRGSEQLYDSFADGYYDANVRPGGVGRNYDTAGFFYDESLARRACPLLARGDWPNG